MSYDKPQSGNPNEMVVNQHVLPAASIKRFYDPTTRMVAVEMASAGKKFPSKANNPLFCAMRTWSETAERDANEIETAFQAIASRVAMGAPSLSADEQKVVTTLFAIVVVRTQMRRNPPQNTTLPDDVQIAGPTFDKDTHEKLEKRGYVALDPNKQIPGRQLAGSVFWKRVGEIEQQMQGASWTVVSSTDGEFLVGDSLDKAKIVPISPTVCLSAEGHAANLSRSEVLDLNRQMKDASENYYFARDFSACPI